MRAPDDARAVSAIGGGWAHRAHTSAVGLALRVIVAGLGEGARIGRGEGAADVAADGVVACSGRPGPGTLRAAFPITQGGVLAAGVDRELEIGHVGLRLALLVEGRERSWRIEHDVRLISPNDDDALVDFDPKDFRARAPTRAVNERTATQGVFGGITDSECRPRRTVRIGTRCNRLRDAARLEPFSEGGAGAPLWRVGGGLFGRA